VKDADSRDAASKRVQDQERPLERRDRRGDTAGCPSVRWLNSCDAETDTGTMVTLMQGRLLVIRLALTNQVKTLTPASYLEPETPCPPRVRAKHHRSYTRVEWAMTVRRRRRQPGTDGAAQVQRAGTPGRRVGAAPSSSSLNQASPKSGGRPARPIGTQCLCRRGLHVDRPPSPSLVAPDVGARPDLRAPGGSIPTGDSRRRAAPPERSRNCAKHARKRPEVAAT
jgi:hypothetical protein